MQKVSCHAERETYQTTKPAPRTMQSRRLRANSLYRGCRKPPTRTALLDLEKDISNAAPQSPAIKTLPFSSSTLPSTSEESFSQLRILHHGQPARRKDHRLLVSFVLHVKTFTHHLQQHIPSIALLALPKKPYREEKAYADHQKTGSRSPAPSASSGSSKNSTSNTTSKSSSATKPAAQAPS
jgi:hypothetical protein